MKVVKVYGALKKQLGGQGTFELDVNTPAEALRALTVNFKGLSKWMIDSDKHGVGYRVQIGNEVIQEEEIGNLLLPFSCLLYTSPSPRDRTRSRMPSSA